MNREQSKLERLTGKYTTSVLIAVLFVITLFCLLITCCLSKDLPDVINLFTNLLLGLAGSLALSLLNDKWAVKVNVDVKNST